MAHKANTPQLSTLEDETLCAMAANGSDPAFEEITSRYKGLISSIAGEYSYPGFDSGDFMQLGLLGLYSACKSFKPEYGVSFKNFAAICIKRRFISLVRSLSAHKAVPKDATVSVDDESLYSQASDPELYVAQKESDAEFFSLIKQRLSCMELAVLKGYVSGMSYKAIAGSLGLDCKAVDNALQRVRKKLL